MYEGTKSYPTTISGMKMGNKIVKINTQIINYNAMIAMKFLAK